MKILEVSTQVFCVPPAGTYGGLEGVVADISEELLKLGHEVAIVCPQGSNVPGAELIMPCEPSHNNPEAEAFLQYQTRLNDFDIVHDHSWGAYPYLWKMQQNPDLKIIHTVHAMVPYGAPPPVKFPNFVGLSKHHSQLISSHLGIHCEVAYNGINIENYPFCDKKEDYLLFVGRIQQEKGPHEFIALCRRLGMRGYVVGEDIFVPRQDYVKRIMDSCDGRQVIYMGRVARGSDQMVELMQHAYALVMPLLPEYYEAFGLYMIEAMSCGTPCIVTDRGSPKEIITQGKTGYVVPTVNELDDAVRKIDRISPQACHKRAIHFSRERMTKRYVELFEQILNGHEW